MAEDNPRIDEDLIDIDISTELKRELTTYRRLLPLMRQCFTLNHDINNPLAGILGYAELLLDDASNLSTDQKDSLNQILVCGKRISKLTVELTEMKSELARNLDLKATMPSIFNQMARSE